MKIIDCKQGSDEWHRARLGIPTASRFDAIITKTGKPSGQAEGYMHELLAEWLIGEPLDNFDSSFMERGIIQEAEAVRWYEFQKDVEATTVGFCLMDDGQAGCSPDRLIGNDGILEIKCPSAKVHVAYLLGSPVDTYKVQIQGNLYICEREWLDILSYNPAMPPKIVRCHRDEEFLDKFGTLLRDFLGRIERAKESLRKEGILDGAVGLEYDSIECLL